jgi:hypothetical protein
MLRFRMICSDAVDEDFMEDEVTPEWEDAVCEDPYWDDEEDEREWCD